MKRAIVTGANGFIGKHLVNYLLEQNVEVWAFVRKKKEQDIEGKLHYVECSLDEYKTLSLDIPGGVDAFFHLAWAGGIDNRGFVNFASQSQNIEYCGNAVLLAKKMGCREFVLISSTCVFEALTGVIKGEANIRYNQVYGSIKCSAEIVCKNLGGRNDINVNICYLPHVYGEGNNSRLVSNVLLHNFIKGEESSLVDGEYLEDWLYVKECVKGIYAVADKGLPMKSYYVGHRKLKPFKEWVTEARDVVNPSAVLHFGAYGADPERNYGMVDFDALCRDTGFEAKEDFREAILNTAEWVKTLDW